MIDNMQGLYASATEAHEAGWRRGQDEAFRLTLRELGFLSSKYEKAGQVAEFRTAEECCKIVRELFAKLVPPEFPQF